MAGVGRPVHARRHLLDAARRLLQDLGRPAGDLRRGPEPDDGAHEARAASGRLVAASAVGNQSRRFQCPNSKKEQKRFADGEEPLPHDGAQARRRAALRGFLYPRSAKNKNRIPDQAAARGHDQRAGRVRLRAAGLGLRAAHRLAPAGLLVAVLVLWQLATWRGLPQYVLGPLEIARAFGEALGTRELWQHIGASLARALPGFGIGSVLGI